MSDDFAAAARRLAGVAGVALGWRPAEFWAATPAELSAIVAVMLHPGGAALPPDAGVLAQLMEAFPDG